VNGPPPVPPLPPAPPLAPAKVTVPAMVAAPWLKSASGRDPTTCAVTPLLMAMLLNVNTASVGPPLACGAVTPVTVVNPVPVICSVFVSMKTLPPGFSVPSDVNAFGSSCARAAGMKVSSAATAAAVRGGRMGDPSSAADRRTRTAAHAAADHAATRSGLGERPFLTLP
jgi:hypothetical protein